MQKEVVSGNQSYDFVGMVLSILCGIHCIVTPLLILSFPILDERLNSPWVHGVLIGFVAWAFYQSVYLHFKLHKSKKTLVTGIVGFVILLGVSLVEIFAHADEHGHGHAILLQYDVPQCAPNPHKKAILGIRCPCLNHTVI